MTANQLMIPRLKCSIRYPDSPFPVGAILEQDFEEPEMYNYTDSNGRTWQLESPENYPEVFNPLQWWEERGVGDMPEYVRIIKSPALTKERLNVGAVVKIYNHFSCSQGNYNKQGCQVFGDDFMSYSTCTPATKEEYEAQHRCQGKNGGCVNSNICQANDKCMWPTNQLKDGQ